MISLYDQEEITKANLKDEWNEGRAEGKAEGKTEGIIGSVVNLMKNAGYPIEKAMELLSVPADKRNTYADIISAMNI